jgi:hypothetical protein
MARRFGSAMISNTDSIVLIYSTEHMRVKVYLGRGSRQQFQSACGDARLMRFLRVRFRGLRAPAASTLRGDKGCRPFPRTSFSASRILPPLRSENDERNSGAGVNLVCHDEPLSPRFANTGNFVRRPAFRRRRTLRSPLADPTRNGPDCLQNLPSSRSQWTHTRLFLGTGMPQ